MASFEQTGKKKLWSVRFRIVENGEEVNKRLSGFKSKKEANAAYLQYLKDYSVSENKTKKPDETLFSQAYENYHSHAKSNLKDGSVRDLEWTAAAKILPVFGDKTVQSIKPIDIVEWQNEMDYSYRYKMKLRYWTMQILKFNAKYYDTPNPMENVDPPKNQEIKKEMDFWTFEEFQKFISVIENDETYKTFFEALYVTGCRRGEMLAISRNDIDENANILSISKSITIRADGAPWKITTPKNKYSVRKIYIPHSLALRMVELAEIHKGQFVFGGDEPLRPTSIDRNMRKYVDKAGVKRIRVHDLRHSCASYLISKGVSILAVSKRLGHATTQQTLNTYSHIMPSDQQYLEGILNEMQI